MIRKLTFAAVALAAVTLAIGCGTSGPPTPQAQNTVPEKTASATGDHGHKAGAHGGFIFSIGADNYHAEVRFEQDGMVRVYLLGRDEARVQEVELQNVTAHALADGETRSVPLEIRADPQPDDSAGQTSQFVGQLPRELWGKSLSLTMPIRIAGERFRPTFKTPAQLVHNGMPKGVARRSEEERKLYLTPGGIYTERDIQANGRAVPSEKFADVSWPHADDLKPGDKLCPVTANKADARCAWVVNGQTYEFCCAPCLDKFVGWAKNEPQKVKKPEDYVYRE